MRLVPCRATHNAVQVRCICHGAWHQIETLHADLDGIPFRAYYCGQGIAGMVIRGEVPRDQVPQSLNL